MRVRVEAALSLHVFDWDRLAMDDKLGAAQVGLEPLLHAPAQGLAYEEVPLSEQGSVHLHLRWATQVQGSSSNPSPSPSPNVPGSSSNPKPKPNPNVPGSSSNPKPKPNPNPNVPGGRSNPNPIALTLMCRGAAQAAARPRRAPRSKPTP